MHVISRPDVAVWWAAAGNSTEPAVSSLGGQSGLGGQSLGGQGLGGGRGGAGGCVPCQDVQQRCQEVQPSLLLHASQSVSFTAEPVNM